MLKRVAGTIAGIATMFAIIIAVEMITVALYPLAPGDDGSDMTGIALSAKLLVCAAWFLGAFGGGWIALRITDWRWSAWIVGGLVLAGGIANIATIRHPLWMQAAAILLPIIAGWIAIRSHRKPYPGEPLIG